MTIDVQKDDLSDGSIERLLQEHLSEMARYSPAESIHALDSASLNNRSITFWSARVNDELVGCGALKEISPHAGEVKSMKTDSRHLRKGIAQKILTAIMSEARVRGYREILLETGAHSAFDPAVALYARHGFEACAPFGNYVEDPYSRYLRKDLTISS